MFENLSEEIFVNHKTYFDLLKMVRQEQAVISYCIALWEIFLSNSWYFYEIAAPVRAETSVFHISRLFYNTFLSSTCSRRKNTQNTTEAQKAFLKSKSTTFGHIFEAIFKRKNMEFVDMSIFQWKID